LVTPEHALHVLEIMLKAKESGPQGCASALQSTFTLPAFAEPAPAEAIHLIHDRTRDTI
jgi:hypothetical protein